MTRIAPLVLLLSACATPVAKAEQGLSALPDAVVEATMVILADMGLNPDDEFAPGMVRFRNPAIEPGQLAGWAKCEGASGFTPERDTVEGFVEISPTPTGADVDVQAVMRRMGYRYEGVFDTTLVCRSTGTLESEIADAIAAQVSMDPTTR